MEDVEDSTEATPQELQRGKSIEDCLSEVNHLFEKLSSWRDESNRQFYKIIDLHTCNISKGINDLSEEVLDLRTKLSSITMERNYLLKY